MKKTVLIEALKAGFSMARRAVRFSDQGSDLSELQYWERIFQDAHAEYRVQMDLMERLGSSWDAVRMQAFMTELKTVHRRYLHIYDHCSGYVEGRNWFQFQRELDASHWQKKMETDLVVILPEAVNESV